MRSLIIALLAACAAACATTACRRAARGRSSVERFADVVAETRHTLTAAYGAAAGAEAAVAPPSTLPRWSAEGSMTVELAAARLAARGYWTRALDTRSLPPWFVDGLVEWSARRVVTERFTRENNPPGFAFVELRYFGGSIPLFVRIREMADTDRLAAGSGDRSTRTLLTLITLERWLSAPALDGALAALIGASTRPTLSDVEQAISAATGEDLSWLFTQTLEGDASFDYAIDSLTTGAHDGGYETTLEAARLGDGQFTGSSIPRRGGFDSGRGVTLRVTFADGQQIRDTWDGRDRRRTFRYESAVPAVSAEIDPDRVIVFDRARTNNSFTLAPRAGAAARRWAARWTAWLQHALLSYAFFV